MTINNNTKYNDVFNNLQDYMLNEENMPRFLDMKLKNNHYNNTDNKYNKDNKDKKYNTKSGSLNKEPKSVYFTPYEKDSLFWCFYIMTNGDVKYEMLENKNIIVEKNLKIEYVEKIRKMKQLVKTYKFTTLTHIENNLANESNLDINTFLTLAALENLNILFIKKKTYFELLMNDTENIYIVSLLENGKYGYKVDTKSNTNDIKSSLYQLDNIGKPIKAFSSYKVQELIDICQKLAIDITNKETQKSKSKKELYEAIVQYF